jgi:hypothetical protein
MKIREPAMPLQLLRARYLALRRIEELPGERTFLGRCNTFARFLEFGAECAASLRYGDATEQPMDWQHPELAALLREAWPALPDGEGEWPVHF